MLGIVFCLSQEYTDRFVQPCRDECFGGSCYYENCIDVVAKCPGGACHFLNCKDPSCTGIHEFD